MLGPQVVGQRVVVRRVLPGETGPTGGPAMTDVLGVCESWSEHSMGVRRADGSLVAIATADIVSGKPVPPRPNVRMRVSARDAEQHALALWPRLVLEPLGDWVLRTDPAPVGRLLKRANSCLAFGDVPPDPPDAVAAVERFYRSRERDPLVQVETGSAADELFAAAGWAVVDGGESVFQVASTAQALRRLEPAPDDVVVEEDAHLLRAAVLVDGTEVASGEAGVDGDWIGVHGLLVAPGHRRQGLARTVMAALLERAAEQGVTTAWLHVETDNRPALALYDGLGFATHHANTYRRAPGV